jgi:ATP adenylyltransferase
MKVLWAPWRMVHIGGPKQPGCIFCDKPVAENRREALVLAVGEHASVMLNKFPYANGHLMVAPRRHTADLGELSAVEHTGLAEALRATAALLREEFRPEGLNIGMNLGSAAGAGIADHLHWHVVPRWIGDTNFMPLIGEVRVMPEHLEAVYERLRPRFEALDIDSLPVS